MPLWTQGQRQQIVVKQERRQSDRDGQKDRDAAQPRHWRHVHAAIVAKLIDQPQPFAETSQQWRQHQRRRRGNQKKCEIGLQLFTSANLFLSDRRL